MGYGYEAKEHNDRKVNVAKDLLQLIGEVFLPGALLVNDLPFCECSHSYWAEFDAHSHQYGTFPNGFHGSATNRSFDMATILDRRSYLGRWNSSEKV